MTLARWSPAGFLAAYVLVSFSATPNPMLALWRPLLVGIGVAVALQLVLSVALRDRDRAALVASATVLVLTAAWVPLAVAATAATWLLIIGWRRRRHGEPDLGISAAMLSRNLAIFALAFAAVSAIPVLSWGVTSWQAAHRDARGQAVAGTPDIV
ncbi:MAG TPA: hypothetical protein VJA85_06530, partial [Candidatus Limnocylindria bacterium]|nr:hypothetical protein [Candidatus Limnocylindria bacterium]